MKKYRGLSSIKSRYGRMFAILWEIGIVFFVIIPIMQSIGYAFSDVKITSSGMETNFIGLGNFLYALKKDAYFLDYMTQSLSKILYSLPSIVVISMIIAVVLNHKFRGRLFFRGLYFLPVIIATGPVIEWILLLTNPTISDAGVDSSVVSGTINITEVMAALGLDGTFVEYFQLAMNQIFNIIWSSGIQIILFIAGMQSIPDSLYEVAKVEGASKWEEFWFITFPMLSRITVLVIIFTMVELMTDKTNSVMDYVYTLMSTLNYDESSAMLWFYLLIASGIMGVVVWAYNHFCAKKWE